MGGIAITSVQWKFIKIKSDPGIELQKLTHKDIGGMLGVSTTCIGQWSRKPIIKDAIKLAREKDPEKVYPRMLREAEDIAFGRVQGASTFEKLRAMELWFKAKGYLKTPKGSESTEKDTSFERKLMAIAGESTRDSSTATDRP